MMMSALRTFAVAFGLFTLAASATALGGRAEDRGDTPELGWGKTGNHVGVPGPAAGVGLPFVAVVGGYIWLRRRRDKAARDLG
jgi:hypothetical protein